MKYSIKCCSESDFKLMRSLALCYGYSNMYLFFNRLYDQYLSCQSVDSDDEIHVESMCTQYAAVLLARVSSDMRDNILSNAVGTGFSQGYNHELLRDQVEVIYKFL